MGAVNQNNVIAMEIKGRVNGTSMGDRSKREKEMQRKWEVEGAADEATRMFLLVRCLFQLARHDFTTASLCADMTSLMQTEPMPSSVS